MGRLGWTGPTTFSWVRRAADWGEGFGSIVASAAKASAGVVWATFGFLIFVVMFVCCSVFVGLSWRRQGGSLRPQARGNAPSL